MKFSQLELQELLKEFFPDLELKEIEFFLTICEYRKEENKKPLLKSGTKDKSVLLILKGAARAFRITEKGKELNNYIRSEGRLIADAKVFGDQVQMLNIESISEIHFLKFDIEKLETLGLGNNKIMSFYLSFLKEIILTLSHRVDTFVTMDAKERYLDLEKWNPSYLKKTQDKHLASFLGITPLTFHRVKNK